MGTLIREYYYQDEYKKYREVNQNPLSYSKWFEGLDLDILLIDDNRFDIELGSALLSIFEQMGFLSIETVHSTELQLRKDKESLESVWKIPNSLSNILDYKNLYTIPGRLPMIVTPKPYKNDELGGYLSNDLYEKDPLFIKKVIYGSTSNIKDYL